MPSAYPANLQAFLSNNSEIKEIEHNRIKSLAGRRQPGGYLQDDRGSELGPTENKSSRWPERDSNPRPPDCESTR